MGKVLQSAKAWYMEGRDITADLEYGSAGGRLKLTSSQEETPGSLEEKLKNLWLLTRSIITNKDRDEMISDSLRTLAAYLDCTVMIAVTSPESGEKENSRYIATYGKNHVRKLFRFDRRNLIRLQNLCAEKNGYHEELEYNGISFGEIFLIPPAHKEWNEVDSLIVKTVITHLSLAMENNRLKEISRRDDLTGLFSKTWFESHLREAARNSSNEPYALIVMDLDHFKEINDTFGHQAGDQVLQKVGDTLKQSVRSSDLAARIGGEEFAILLKGTSLEAAIRVAEKIRKRIMKIRKPNREPLTASFGVSEGGFMKGHITVFREADQALYMAKNSGRNLVKSV